MVLTWGIATVRRFILALVLAVCAIASPAHAQQATGWWSKDWPYRKAVTVDTAPSGANLSGAIGRTVLLVRLHNGNFTFPDALENGADLRVVDSDGKTPLPFHIERFDATNGIAALWVAVPKLAGGEKRTLWIYFGNKNATAASDVAGTYDPDTIAAYHFSENAGQPVRDLTAYKNNAQNAAPGRDDNGIIARAAKFAGQGELVVPASPSLTMAAGKPLTLESWVKLDKLDGEQATFARGALVLGFANGLPFAQIGGQRLQGTTPVQPGAWAHLAFVADGTANRLYVNGVEAAQGAGALPALDGPMTLGGAAGRPFSGELDETRLSRTARPAAMILASAQGEGPSNKLLSVADAAERQSAGGGTLMFIIGKIEAVDGAIIAICLLMLAVALAVMVAKARYVGRARRANAAFMKRFRAMHEQLVSVKTVAGISPREVAVVAGSPLGRIYEEGIDEVEVRRSLYGNRPLTERRPRQIATIGLRNPLQHEERTRQRHRDVRHRMDQLVEGLAEIGSGRDPHRQGEREPGQQHDARKQPQRTGGPVRDAKGDGEGQKQGERRHRRQQFEDRAGEQHVEDRHHAVEQQGLVRIERRLRPRHDRPEDHEGAISDEREGDQPQVRGVMPTASPAAADVDERDRGREHRGFDQHPHVSDVGAPVARLDFPHDQRADHMALDIRAVDGPPQPTAQVLRHQHAGAPIRLPEARRVGMRVIWIRRGQR